MKDIDTKNLPEDAALALLALKKSIETAQQGTDITIRNTLFLKVAPFWAQAFMLWAASRPKAVEATVDLGDTAAVARFRADTKAKEGAMLCRAHKAYSAELLEVLARYEAASIFDHVTVNVGTLRTARSVIEGMAKPLTREEALQALEDSGIKIENADAAIEICKAFERYRGLSC